MNTSFRTTAALMSRLARTNPEATEEQLEEFFAQAVCEGRLDNPYGVGNDEDEPKDHTFNDEAPWAGEFSCDRENFHSDAGGFNSGDDD